MSKKQHLSRLAAPRKWPISRKASKWIAKTSPGSHSLKNSIPLVVILRDILKLASNSKNVKYLLSTDQVLVNNRKVKDIKFAVGLLDVVSLPKIKTYYRVILKKQGTFAFIKIPESESNIMLLRIKNKKVISKGKVQLNFNNGWNIIVKKDDYKTNEVIIFDTKTNTIKSKLVLKSGASVYLVGGKHRGILAKYKSVREYGTLKKHKIVQVIDGKTELESSVENIMVIGEAKPAIKLE